VKSSSEGFEEPMILEAEMPLIRLECGSKKSSILGLGADEREHNNTHPPVGAGTTEQKGVGASGGGRG